jgi:hypothetical protein
MAEESPRSRHHKTGRRTAFGHPEQPGFNVGSREGQPKRDVQVEEARDPSVRLRDRRDEHVPAGEINPTTRRRDAIAHWERATIPDRRRERG